MVEVPEYIKETGRVKIRADVDMKFRQGLTEIVSKDGGCYARWQIKNALQNGPSRGGYVEAAQYFGKEFDTKLKLTVPIVEACEVSMPGFGKWLEQTGFGNDVEMIKGFVLWAEFKNNQGTALPTVFDQVREKFLQ